MFSIAWFQEKNGAHSMEANRSCTQVVQGVRCFRWKTSKASAKKVLELQERNLQAVELTDDGIDQACNRWKMILIDKILSKRLPVDFTQNELRLRWNIQGNFQVSTLSKGFLLFDLPYEEVQDRILAKGPWTLVGQRLVLESWRLNFNSSLDKIW